MNSRSFAFAIALCACICGLRVDFSARAQDPFDDIGGDSAQNTPRRKIDTAGSESSIDSNERDAVVRSLRANPPTSPEELASAIRWMGRIRRWDEVGRWLTALGQKQIDPQTALRVQDRAGTNTWLEIEGNANLFTPAQLAVVARIRSLAEEAVSSPAALTQNIRQLYSDSRTERIAGFQGLKGAGYSGIAAILNAVSSEQGVTPNGALVEAFSLLGPQATRAWHTAMTTPHDDVRDRLVQLVARAPQPDMGCELLAALHDPKVSEASKQSVQKSLLDREQAVPSNTQVYRYTLRQLDKSIADYRHHLALNDLDTDIGWQLQGDGRTVQPIRATGADGHLNRASQAALTSLRLTAQGDVASARAVAVHLEQCAQRGDRDLTANTEFQKILPDSLRDSHEFASLVWDAAVKENLPGAQALATSNLSRWTGPLQPNAVRDRLVAATKSGYPFVRYPAAVALMNSVLESRNGLETADSSAVVETGEKGLPPETAAPASPSDMANPVLKLNSDRKFDSRFEGRSRLDVVGREMQQFLADPLVLIVGGSPSLRSHMHGLADQLGFRFLEAASVRDVFDTLRSGAPIEAVFIIDHLRDMDLGQLIQRIRSNPSTSTVPIALLADSLSRGEHSVAAADHRVVMGSVPPEVDGLGDILRRFQHMTEMPRVDSSQRILWKESASNYFRATAPENPKDGIHPVTGLLASTQEEQQNLLRIVADGEAGVSKREQASQIFVQSVRRFGLLISSESANAQYDVYNARGGNEPVTRAVMGRVLDAIEASTGQRSWSEIGP
jgi:CheY-like chemotaxis protein